LPSPKSGKPTGKNGLRVVAMFEATKGALVLLAGCGLLAFIHKDLHDAAVQLVKALHFNPAKHYPSIFIDAADRVTDVQLWMLALSALLYSVVRFVEAYGLWKRQQWAEWFGFLSGGMYIPMEVFEVSRQLTWPRMTVLIVNIGVVAYLSDILWRTRRRRKHTRRHPAGKRHQE
jgi:uncharacterized membrane protein (DUF2068 family)